MTEPRWLDEDEHRCWRAFQMMQMRLAAQLAHDLSRHSDLSYQDYEVLVALTDQPEGRVRLFELGSWLGWEKSRLSHQVSRMVERDLVVKRTCASDRRGAFVEVTAHGRRMIEQAAPSHVAAVRRLFVDRLSRAQLQQLSTISGALLEALDQDAFDQEGCGHKCPEGGPA